MQDELLERIDAYLDEVPRRGPVRAEPIGPFTLFVTEGPGWPYYARPTIGATGFSEEDALRVRERQRELGIVETFE